MTRPLRFPLLTLAFTVIVAVFFGFLGGGCVKRQEVFDHHAMDRMAKKTSAAVVAIATSTADDPTHLTLCSGALVAPNLVLTARHCVSRAVTATPSCDTQGQSHNGDHLAEDVDPASIAIYTGSQIHPDSDRPVAHGVRALHPAGQVLCDADVAFLVLDRPVPNANILPMRLHSSVKMGESIVPVGFGGGPSNTIGRKVAHTNSTVLALGPTANRETGAVLGPHEFEVDQATCRGDSGGPAIDPKTGEVVGVISRGGSCTSLGNHVYTRVDAYTRLAQAAFDAASREL